METQILSITKGVNKLLIRFTVSNPKYVPRFLRIPEVNGNGRTRQIPGKVILEQLEKCSFANLISQLNVAGFTLVDAMHQRKAGVDYGKPFSVISFVFVKEELAEIAPEDVPYIRVADDALVELLKGSAWRTKAYKNVVEDGLAVSINLGARFSLLKPNGSPVMVWQKNGNGNKDTRLPKIPIQPDHKIQLEAV